MRELLQVLRIRYGLIGNRSKLNVGVYALFRTNLGIVSSTICMNSGFARAPWEADFCDLRASMPIPEPRDLSAFTLDNSLSIRCLKPNMDWQINYDDGAGTAIDILYRSIMPPFDIHDPDVDPMKAKALKAAEAGENSPGERRTTGILIRPAISRAKSPFAERPIRSTAFRRWITVGGRDRSAAPRI